MSLPTVPQMARRSSTGHIRLLQCLSTASPFFDSQSLTMGSLRGYRTMLATLRRWECIDAADKVTDRGRQLIDARGAS